MMMSALLNLLLVVIVLGVVLGLVNRYLPMPALIKSLVNILALLILIVYVLQTFSFIPVYFPVVEWVHVK